MKRYKPCRASDNTVYRNPSHIEDPPCAVRTHRTLRTPKISIHCHKNIYFEYDNLCLQKLHVLSNFDK